MKNRNRFSPLLNFFLQYLSLGSDLVPTPAQDQQIKSRIANANCRRGGIYCGAIFVMEILLILLLDLPRLKEADPEEAGVFGQYLLLHGLLGIVTIVFILIFLAIFHNRRGGQCSLRLKFLPPFFLVLILSLLSLIALLDLQGTGQLVVYTSSMLIAGLLCLIRFPGNLPVFGVPFIIFFCGCFQAGCRTVCKNLSCSEQLRYICGQSLHLLLYVQRLLSSQAEKSAPERGK